MKFNASIHKVGMVTKKDGEIERNYLQINILVPISPKTDFAAFARHYRNTSHFTMQAIQGDLLKKGK